MAHSPEALIEYHLTVVVGEFYPPAGMSPTNFELNNVELLADKDYMTSSAVINDSCDLQPPQQPSPSIPIPVQEIMDAEGLYVSPPKHREGPTLTSLLPYLI